MIRFLHTSEGGHYLGTEIDDKWWRRYAKDGLLARGIGEFGMDESSMIAFRDVLDVKVGKWHSGKWAGGQPVVKIIWKKAENRLSSGFVLSRDAVTTETLVQEIRLHVQQASNGRRLKNRKHLTWNRQRRKIESFCRKTRR